MKRSAAPAAGAGRPVPRVVTAAEIAALFTVLVSYIWWWRDAFPGATVLVLALYVGLGAETHWRRRESPRAIGFRLDNLGPFLRLAAAWLAVPLAVGLAAGRTLGAWSFPAAPAAAASLSWSVVWGTAQEYGLACVFYRRLRDLLPVRRAAMAAGVLFALLHLPNPFMMGLTLLMGVLASHLYERQPNVPGLGIAHAVTSFLLANALPGWLTFDWRVGPQILPRLLALLR